MTARRPRDIGTTAETAVVRIARAYGFPHADRLALHGRMDIGDVGLCPGVVVEVKGGETARNASDLLVDAWLDQTAAERTNAGAEVAFLVVQRRGVGAPNAARWWAFWRLSWLEQLTSGMRPNEYEHPSLTAPVRMQLGPTLDLLRAYGFGEEYVCLICHERPASAGLFACGRCIIAAAS